VGGTTPSHHTETLGMPNVRLQVHWALAALATGVCRLPCASILLGCAAARQRGLQAALQAAAAPAHCPVANLWRAWLLHSPILFTGSVTGLTRRMA